MTSKVPHVIILKGGLHYAHNWNSHVVTLCDIAPLLSHLKFLPSARLF